MPQCCIAQFKYVELFDTVLLALRNKPLDFLHWYHHAATLLLCWMQLRAQTCVQWLGVFCVHCGGPLRVFVSVVIYVNLFVHIIMYAYYGMAALGMSPWWKRYLTQLQVCSDYRL